MSNIGQASSNNFTIIFFICNHNILAEIEELNRMLTFPAGSTGEMRINDIQTLTDNVYFGNRVVLNPGPLTLTDGEGNVASPGVFVINDQTSE